MSRFKQPFIANATRESNDFFDIDALAVAVPYCNLVATDKQRYHTLLAEGCAQRFGTAVVARPAELLAALNGLGVPAH